MGIPEFLTYKCKILHKKVDQRAQLTLVYGAKRACLRPCRCPPRTTCGSGLRPRPQGSPPPSVFLGEGNGRGNGLIGPFTRKRRPRKGGRLWPRRVTRRASFPSRRGAR